MSSGFNQYSSFSREKELERHNKRLEQIKNGKKNSINPMQKQNGVYRGRSVENLHVQSQSLKQKFEIDFQNKLTGKRLLEISRGEKANYVKEFYNQDYIAQKDNDIYKSQILESQGKSVSKTPKSYSYKRNFEINSQNQQMINRIVNVKSEFAKLPKIGKIKNNNINSNNSKQKNSKQKLKQNKSALFMQNNDYYQQEQKPKDIENSNNNSSNLENQQKTNRSQSTAKLMQNNKKDLMFQKYLVKEQQQQRKELPKLYKVEKPSSENKFKKKYDISDINHKIVIKEEDMIQEDIKIQNNLSNQHQLVKSSKVSQYTTVKVQIKFKAITLNNIIPKSEDQETYYFNIRLFTNKAYNTLPKDFQDFQTQQLIDNIDIKDFKKSTTMYIQIYQNKKGNKQKVNLKSEQLNMVGECVIQLKEVINDIGNTHNISEALRNLKENNHLPNYIAKDYREKGIINFDITMYANT